MGGWKKGVVRHKMAHLISMVDVAPRALIAELGEAAKVAAVVDPDALTHLERQLKEASVDVKHAITERGARVLLGQGGVDEVKDCRLRQFESLVTAPVSQQQATHSPVRSRPRGAA